MRRVLLVLILAGVLGLVAGCSAADEATEEAETTSTIEVAATAVAPDLVALVGESSLTAENAEASGGSIHYGDAALMDGYQAKAQEFGLTVEFTVLSENDETFMHGMAGWPIGQDPKPGMQMDSGSPVKLVVIEEDAGAQAGAGTSATSPTITMETGESPCYVRSVETVNGVDYVTVDYVVVEFTQERGYDEEVVTNTNPKLRTFELTDTSWLGAFTVAAEQYGGQDGDYATSGDKAGYPLERADFVRAVRESDVNANYWNIKVQDGRVLTLAEAYAP